MFKDRLKIFSHKFLSKKFIFVMDTCISLLVSIFVAVAAFFLGDAEVQTRTFNLVWGISSVLASGIAFCAFNTYSIIIRHFTFRDTIRFSLAVLLKVVIMLAATILLHRFSLIVIAMLVADFFLTLVTLCGVRLLMIVVYDSYKGKIREAQKCCNVLVYEVNDKSISTVVRLRGSKHYNVCGFISPDRSIKGNLFSDKRVYTFESMKDLEGTVRSLSLGGVLFSTDADLQLEQDRLVKYCSRLSVKVLIVPSIDEPGSLPDINFKVREVKIEDLLGREEIQISMDAIKENFKDKVVLVTGAAGSIGSELCRQLAGFGVGKLLLYDNAETPMHLLRLELESRFPDLNFIPIIGDVRLEARLDYAFRQYHPQVVFHAAAYKHVPLMEENPCEAVLVNVAGTRNVADKCIQYGAEKMVMISTDKAVNPTNIMGCTKRLAEIYVQSLGQAVASGKVAGKTNFVTTRFGNVLGSNGSVIPLFREQIANGGPVTVTDKKITRFFMTIPEACRLVLEAATLRTENRICVFDMGEPVKIDTLARKMIELTGLVPDEYIKIVYTGLRPGEKLYEEVLSNVENTEPTMHEKIRIARVRQYDYSEASDAAAELERLSRDVQIPQMVMLMKKIVPEYVSNNSVFEIYDNKKDKI